MKFYRRLWFKILLSAALILAIIALIVGSYILAPYHGTASSYDMAALKQDGRSTLVFGHDDAPVGTLFGQDRRPVTRDEIPQHLVDILVATEDSRFFSHGGWDPRGMIRAAVANIKRGGIAQGASTLTQQLSRNAYTIKEKRFARKAVEIFLARRIEDAYSKDEILTLYLNEVYFGNGFYGIESAAQGYFGKAAIELDIQESATLVGLIKRPNSYNPFTDIETARTVRDHALRRARSEGKLTAPQLESALAEPISPLPESQRTTGGISALTEIENEVEQALGRRPTATDGLRVYTSIEPTVQSALAAAIRKHIGGFETPDAKADQLQGAAVVIDNATAEIIAAVGSQKGRAGGFDRAFSARRPPGTAFTPLVFAAALEAGISPYFQVLDTPLDNNKVMIGGLQGILGEWGSEGEFASYSGEISAREAIVRGKNAATVRLGFQVGVDPVINLARKAGITSSLTAAPPIFLGQSDVTPAEIALAYSTIPNRGYRAGNISVLRRIEDASGKVIFERTPPAGFPVMSETTAYEVHSALIDALEEGTARDSITSLGLEHMPSGGKTGTSYRLGDAWFVGYNSRVTCAVWSGFDRPERIAKEGFGHVLALPVWVDTMNATVKKFPPDTIEPPAGTIPVQVCNRSGMEPTEYCLDETPKGPVASTHRGYLTPDQVAALVPCQLHGPVLANQNDIPRALPAEITSRFYPVTPAHGALVGTDPFAITN